MTDQPVAELYLPDPAALADVLRSAAIARTNSHQTQRLHHHAHGSPCVDQCGPLDDLHPHTTPALELGRP